MRPIRLGLRGFTAFRDEQSIDFTALDLFAISGPTGSGKTSILDAMTYALFGHIDRVGRQAGQFISQGQPRLSVTLEFAVGEERYRVARSTPARGQTRILLEAWNGAEWVQAGEGADRVRDVDEAIRRAIGLDYDAFTRTVLLPQGKFAEFLVGEARTRREILTELLGLDLFERLARRAGELKRAAALEADTRAQLLEREYAGVTPDAVAEAERVAKEAAEADARAADAERRVRDLADRWAETARSVADLRACASEAAGVRDSALDAARRLEAIAEEASRAEAVSEAAAAAAAAAAADAERATEALREAREAWGTAAELGSLVARAGTLAERREDLAEIERELAMAGAAVPALEGALAAAERIVADAVAGAEAAISALAEAREGEERAAHADHVAAVRAGMKAGDDCPVCGARVGALPKGRGAPTLERARAARAKAETAAERAEAAMREASSARDRAERSVVDARAAVARVERDLTRVREDTGKLERDLADAFGGELPDDPAAELAVRVERLEQLDAACDDAAATARIASERAAAAERAAAEIRTGLAEIGAAVGSLALVPLADRSAALLGTKTSLPRRPAKKDPATLSAYAAGVAETLDRLAVALADAADERASGEASVLDKAAAIVHGLVAPEPTLAALVESVSRARTGAARSAATAEQRAEDLRAKLANAERIVEEAAGHRARAAVFDALSRELDARHIIPFLQAEALQLLAAAGSRRLETLSGGRYRLEYVDDEFSVVDTWNGEERRSARTLSGGETFLASLALALGLSEQVRALAVSDRAMLDALFLDEGFGTLDPESLEVVVDAIEQLGGDGRMVGVITHVQELALRLPARIEVEKSPRGSRLRVVT
jgi:DNA repair protein SbcC/Rad50